MIRRSSTAVLAAALCLAACSKPTAPATSDPKAMLGASTAGLTAGNYRYTIDSPDAHIEGTMDLASRGVAWTTTYQHTGVEAIEIRLIGQDQYTGVRRDATNAAAKKKDLRRSAATTDDPDVKADLAASIREIDTADHRFRHTDLSRIPQSAASMGLTLTDPDRTAATKLLSTVQTAAADGQKIRGTMVINGPMAGEVALVTLGERILGTTAFTATLDGQGRLNRLEIDLPASKQPAGRWTLTIDGYGTTRAPERPTAVKERPKEFYETIR